MVVKVVSPAMTSRLTLLPRLSISKYCKRAFTDASRLGGSHPQCQSPVASFRSFDTGALGIDRCGCSFGASISRGNRQSCAETCPASTQAKRVMIDPAMLQAAAMRRNFRDFSFEGKSDARRRPRGIGPDNMPPVRMIHPL